MTNVQNIEKWVKALRGGKYKQGLYRLWEQGESGTDEKYCALGVAGAIMRKERGEEIQLDNSDATYNSISDWIGTGFTLNVVLLNDNDRLTFSQIANLIEENYLKEKAHDN